MDQPFDQARYDLKVEAALKFAADYELNIPERLRTHAEADERMRVKCPDYMAGRIKLPGHLRPEHLDQAAHDYYMARRDAWLQLAEEIERGPVTM